MATLTGQASIKGSSEVAQMVLLNFCTIGITFTWGIEMTYCTPYLLKLGLTKSNTSLIWIAGPLSGLIVQPIIGVIADESTSKYGRRRPFMVIGSAIVAVCLIVLGFTKELVTFFTADDALSGPATIGLAVLSIYVLDFAINAVMSCSRSLIVDTLPLEKQQAGAAWASRMSSVGNIIGYGAGAVDLLQIFGSRLGDSQFQQLTVIAAVAILVTTGITCWAVQEKTLVPAKGANEPQKTALGVLRQIYGTIKHLPPRVEAICKAVFWSWIGWFPFLFYSTTWVGETYFRYDVAPDARKSEDALGEMGRIGSTSLVIFSFITCTGAFVLPLLIRSPDDDTYTMRPPRAMAGALRRLNEVKPDLLTAWVFSQLMFAATMAFAPFARSFRFATALVCLCGVPWTISGWAPTALLGIEVNKMSGGSSSGFRRLSNEPDIELPNLADEGSSSLLGTPSTGSSGELSGIYFGILNIYTTIPQFLGTLIATIVFSILEPGKSRELAGGDADEPAAPPNADGPNAIAVCLFIGAMASVVASFATRKLRRL